jgi:hypothetical protein
MSYTATSTTKAAPTVILNDDTAPSTEASETTAQFYAIVGYTPIDYPALTDLEVLDGLVTGATDRIRDRHWTEFVKRVRPVVEATARKRFLNNPDDRDDAVSYALAKVVHLEEHKKLVRAVRRGKKLANCVAAFLRGDSIRAELDKGRYLKAKGPTKETDKAYRTVTFMDFTDEESFRAIGGNAYTLDPLDEALDIELNNVKSEAEIAREWFLQVISAHMPNMPQRWQDALLHKSGITTEATDYISTLASNYDALSDDEKDDLFEVLGALESVSDRRTSAPSVPDRVVGEILGVARRTAGDYVSNGKQDIASNKPLVRELRRGVDGTRRVIFEDITEHLIDWLKTYADQAGVTADETTVRAIPSTYWTTVMDEFGYDVADYTNDDIADIIDAVIAGVVA